MDEVLKINKYNFIQNNNKKHYWNFEETVKEIKNMVDQFKKRE
jgi:hypothetical protein